MQESKGFDIQTMNTNGDWKAAKEPSRFLSQAATEFASFQYKSFVLKRQMESS